MKTMIWSIPVSYTHLDVYKRQRFGYNLLLDEENSIEKKLHTPVLEEWEDEEDEI